MFYSKGLLYLADRPQGIGLLLEDFVLTESETPGPSHSRLCIRNVVGPAAVLRSLTEEPAMRERVLFLCALGVGGSRVAGWRLYGMSPLSSGCSVVMDSMIAQTDFVARLQRYEEVDLPKGDVDVSAEENVLLGNRR